MLLGLLAGAALAAACGTLAWASVPDDVVFGTFERELDDLLREGSSEQAKASTLDELLADVDRHLERRSQWALASMRLALFGGGAAAIAVGFGSGVRAALALLPGMMLGLMLAWRSARQRRVAIQRIRSQVDELVSSRAPSLLEVPLPAADLSRRRRRRSGRR